MCFIFSTIRGDRCVEGLYWISDNHERKRERPREKKEKRTGKFPMGLFDASVCLLHCLCRYVRVFAFDISQTYLSFVTYIRWWALSFLFLFLVVVVVFHQWQICEWRITRKIFLFAYRHFFSPLLFLRFFLPHQYESPFALFFFFFSRSHFKST